MYQFRAVIQENHSGKRYVTGIVLENIMLLIFYIRQFFTEYIFDKRVDLYLRKYYCPVSSKIKNKFANTSSWSVPQSFLINFKDGIINQKIFYQSKDIQ